MLVPTGASCLLAVLRPAPLVWKRDSVPQLLFDGDIDPQPLATLRVGIIGYGNQGRAQALNLRDSGVDVRVGVRRGGPSARAALADGFAEFDPVQVAAWAELLMLLVPDEAGPRVVSHLAEALGPGTILGFAHGFNVTYERLAVPAGTRSLLVSPCAPGARLRKAYERGGGVFAYVAAQDNDAAALAVALAYARAIGAGRAGVWVTDFRSETEVDLFGEQAVLCGGMHALLTAAFDTLVEAGYDPEMAYLECVHQLAWLASTVQEVGVAGTRERISSTALYGDVTRGPRVIGAESRAALKTILAEVRSGAFAREFLAAMNDEDAAAALRRRAQHPGMASAQQALATSGRTHPQNKAGVEA